MCAIVYEVYAILDILDTKSINYLYYYLITLQLITGTIHEHSEKTSHG